MKLETQNPETFRGVLHKIIYQNDENGYLIGLLKVQPQAGLNTGGATISIVGYMLQPREGDSYSVTGRWTTHAKYGKQFQFEQYEIHAPTTLHGIEEYLASGLIRGIGPAFASRIVRKFGAKTLQILEKTPERLLEVEGVGRKKLGTITEAASSLRAMQDVLAFLKSYDIGTSHAIKIFKAYGKGAIGVVQNNPYHLMQDISGIGFQIADAIAQKVGVERESLFRLEAGIRFVLDEACRAAGHCYLLQEELVRRAADLLAVDEAKIERAADSSIHNNVLVEENDRLFPFPLHEAEKKSVRKLEQLLRKGVKPFSSEKLSLSLAHIERCHNIAFDVKQRDAILHAVQQPVTILTGGPGTGKTLCVNGIIELADELGIRYLLCAPTGRAAKRLAELSHREAKTIPRLLEYEPQSGLFRRDAESPLDCNFLIVDEMSMVDIQLFAALLEAVKPESQLVMVGDVDQLPSVGPGQVLRDLIESKKIPTVRLNTIFRQSEQSSIILNSHRLNEGAMPEFGHDFRLIEEREQEEIQKKVVALCSTILPQNFRYDAFDDIQVLSPMHQSLSGVRELNKALQHALNGHAKVCWQGSERKFLLGDKVMQTKNNYDKDVFNGDIGRVSGVDKEDGLLLVNFYGRTVDYDFEHLDELTLAYAMTIHKSQGNEFKAVIVPLSTAHYIMLQRNLVYTAVTRAREQLILVGEMKALAIAIRNDDVRERNTMLRQRLVEMV
ncbi:MAG: ATP-dependent RecD-like DNA helicase [Bacteroidota bacterium]|nr:ATP-dependent RecD-like DNA helicase [Bacteroidota bacterium]